MALAQKLAAHFTSTVRMRGLEYFRSGRVRIIDASPTIVEAEVRGSKKYEVDITLEDGEILGHCDCPYAEGSFCKHLWAVILAADANGYLTAIPAGASFAPVQDDMDDLLGEDDDLGSGFELREPGNRSAERGLAVVPKGGSPGSRWRDQLAEIDRSLAPVSRPHERWPERRQLLYSVDLPASRISSDVHIELFMRDRKQKGEGWNRMKEFRLTRVQIPELPDPADREILSLLTASNAYYGWNIGSGSDYSFLSARFRIGAPLSLLVIPLMCRSGRLFLRQSASFEPESPLLWDDGPPWQFRLEIQETGKSWSVAGLLFRGEESMPVAQPVLIAPGGLVFTEATAARLAEDAPFAWINHLRRNRIEAARDEGDLLIAGLLERPGLPPIALPPGREYTEERVVPKLRLQIRNSRNPRLAYLEADLQYEYGGRVVTSGLQAKGIFDPASRRLMLRDPAAEAAAEARLAELGVRPGRPTFYDPTPGWQVVPRNLPRVVRTLTEEGWHVRAEGKTFRRAVSQRLEVSSGIDWFELHGEVDFGGSSANLPAILDALRRGEEMVRLGDGTFGLLPEEWLARFAPLAGLGTETKDHVRFRQNQAGLLDALLASRPEISYDEAFARMRSRLREFEAILPAEQPAGFEGQLRDYQREGLGWMVFLREFGFGGCLADDMGVGKTAQVLALLETRRQLRQDNKNKSRPGPSLVVVPRSLVFNWREEAARFTPQLRVLDHTGNARSTAAFDSHDVVLTTYGTLRRDAAFLTDIEFDYIILDEAQAVKNSNTESAKAVRILQGQHRLALSGTPVENHLGELWSLFEFLNPGMLGSARVFQMNSGGLQLPDPETQQILAHALRPFILRRTKQQVARELPPKSEQTIYCEMDAPQRKLYDELRAHYRSALLGRIDKDGLQKSKIFVLEALLRLRQAACHPGLIDERRSGEPSAKLDVLLDQLEEIVSEGHKALVFSQFTSLLAIVRKRLDERNVRYEYLDGATRDRQKRVERFQADPDCPLFLISLKAGGLGLNLTAAEYVFLLDPWWNPATEAQAVDRAHRIGQTQQVFAYRLITRGTVEEKVLELQSKKRDLAAAIITQANSVMRDLKREDLEVLLS